MNKQRWWATRGWTAVIATLTLAAAIGCGGGAKLKGRLIYQDDRSRPTAGDSVWVYVKGREDIGATIRVKSDNTWEYQPKAGKAITVWSPDGELPPLGSKTGPEPVLKVGAQNADHKTLIKEIYFSEQKGTVIELEYVPLPPADDSHDKKPLRDIDVGGGISP